MTSKIIVLLPIFLNSLLALNRFIPTLLASQQLEVSIYKTGENKSSVAFFLQSLVRKYGMVSPPEVRKLRKAPFKRKLTRLLLKILETEEMNEDMTFLAFQLFLLLSRESLALFSPRANVIYVYLA